MKLDCYLHHKGVCWEEISGISDPSVSILQLDSILLRCCIIYQQSSEKDCNSGFSFPLFQVRIAISDPGARLRARLKHQTSMLRQMAQHPLCETWKHSGVTQMPKCSILSNIRHLWACTEAKFHVSIVHRVMQQLSKMLWDLVIKLYLMSFRAIQDLIFKPVSGIIVWYFVTGPSGACHYSFLWDQPFLTCGICHQERIKLI